MCEGSIIFIQGMFNFSLKFFKIVGFKNLSVEGRSKLVKFFVNLCCEVVIYNFLFIYKELNFCYID